jgi:predicted nuclease with TOPRIM domain
MNRKSFIDLTSLLDVMLILFFAALINMASSSEMIKEENQEVLNQFEEEKEMTSDLQEQLKNVTQSLNKVQDDLTLRESELASLYGQEVDDLDDYKEILSKISKLDVMLVGNNNELWINGQEKDINIIRERLVSESRKDILREDIRTALNLAIEQRDKSDIIFLRVTVKDKDVYKYAYDYLVDVLEDVIKEYGEDKVIVSRQFD